MLSLKIESNFCGDFSIRKQKITELPKCRKHILYGLLDQEEKKLVHFLKKEVFFD
jgi:hypothetical protein